MTKATHVAIAVALALLPTGSSLSQTHKPGIARSFQDELLAKPVEWTPISRRMFSDSEKAVAFSLVTSWIPGENHVGVFRYKIKVVPVELTGAQKALEMNIPEAIEKLLRRVSASGVELELNDADGFILRRVPVSFDFGVYEGHVQSLLANSSSQMDANEYRTLIGSSGKSGQWDIGWGIGP